MTANFSFFVLIGFLLILGGTVYLINSRITKQKLKSIKSDWFDFKRAIEVDDINLVIQTGIRLCQNRNLNKSQLNIISNYVEQKLPEFPSLEKLNLAILNKRAEWQRQVPY